MDQDRIPLKNFTLPNTVTSTELDGLQPGTRYTVTVVAEAVGLTSSTSKQAITGRNLSEHPNFCSTCETANSEIQLNE